VHVTWEILTLPVPVLSSESVPDAEVPTSVLPKLRLELLSERKWVAPLVAVPETLTVKTLLLRAFVLKTMLPE
jgi:hypothetical protein